MSATFIVSITFRCQPKRHYINFSELVCRRRRVGLSASWSVGELVVGELVCRRVVQLPCGCTTTTTRWGDVTRCLACNKLFSNGKRCNENGMSTEYNRSHCMGLSALAELLVMMAILVAGGISKDNHEANSNVNISDVWRQLVTNIRWTPGQLFNKNSCEVVVPVCPTETWIKPTTTPAELVDCTMPGYTLISHPRTPRSQKSQNVSGGTAFLVREPFSQIPSPISAYTSFEASAITLKTPLI